MRKYFYIFLGCLLFQFSSFAQQAFIKALDKNDLRNNVHDTSSHNYNKGKIYFNLGLGYSDIMAYLGDNTAREGSYGTISSSYNVVVLPTINFYTGYGITEKSTLGISTTLYRLNFNPATSSPNLTPGSINLLAYGIRYTHCITMLNYVFYGFQIGWCHWGLNINPNTYQIPFSINNELLNQNLYFILGFKWSFTKNIGIHAEIAGGFPATSINAGLTYKIDTRKKEMKK